MKASNVLASLLLLLSASSPSWATTYAELAAAIKGGDKAQVAALLEGGLSPMAAGAQNQSPPLVLAVVTRQHEIARMLLARGAHPDARHATYYDATGLMLAVNNRDIEMARLLLGAGANPNLTDKSGDSALNWATFHGDEAMAELLLSYRIDATLYGHGNALDVALRRGHQALVQRYVDYLGRRQGVSAADAALFHAVAAGKPAELKTALAGGARVDARDGTGRSALGLAARSGDAAMVAALLDAGAPVDVPDPIGFTPLMEAARDGKLEAARLLLERGADVRRRAAANGLELTALHLATASGQRELVELLVSRGADINARDIEHATPLLWATNQQPEIAVLLAKMGADPDIAPKEGDAPRAIARKRKMDKLLEAMAPAPAGS